MGHGTPCCLLEKMVGWGGTPSAGGGALTRPPSASFEALRVALAEAQGFWSDLQELVPFHVPQVVVQAHGDAAGGLALGRPAHATSACIVHGLLLGDVAFQVLFLVADANAHARVDLRAGAYEGAAARGDVRQSVRRGLAGCHGDDGALVAQFRLALLHVPPVAEARVQDCLATRALQQFALHADEVGCGDVKSHDQGVFHGARVHCLHDCGLFVELLHDCALIRAVHLHHCLFIGFLLLASFGVLAVDHLWRAHHYLEALTPQALHEDT
mmetsp:Transcript_38132/g.106138  ORF Transcript_38132/g.106138 Transcript_38132/m.106138 type:complete len:270 (-) Transcript_38132:1192-2001(-)